MGVSFPLILFFSTPNLGGGAFLWLTMWLFFTVLSTFGCNFVHKRRKIGTEIQLTQWVAITPGIITHSSFFLYSNKVIEAC